MWEVGLPPSPVEFSSHRHFYKLSCSKVAGWVLWLLPSPASLFVRDFPSPIFGAQGTPPSLLHAFFVVIAYYSVFFFFPWMEVGLSRGLC
jgi:hypothetical protein